MRINAKSLVGRVSRPRAAGPQGASRPSGRVPTEVLWELSAFGIPLYFSDQTLDTLFSDLPLGGTSAEILAYTRSRNLPTYRLRGGTPDETIVVYACCVYLFIVQPAAFVFSNQSWDSVFLSFALTGQGVAGPTATPVSAASGPLSLLAQQGEPVFFFFPPRWLPPNANHFLVPVTWGRVPIVSTTDGFDIPIIFGSAI